MPSTSTAPDQVTAIDPAADHAPAAHQDFRRRREQSLSAPYGVLSQVGLFWIDPREGEQTFEALPGRWRLEGESLVVDWEGTELEILADAAEVQQSIHDGHGHAVFSLPGDVRLASFGEDIHVDVIRRGGRTGLRLLDPSAPRRTDFTGVPTHPYDPALIAHGTWSANAQDVAVASALPWLPQQLPSPGRATLDIAGTPVELVLTGEAAILFTDETSGTSSADWRVVTAQTDGETIRVDFNQAVNFPAAFSIWATCPRPPAQNHIPLPIRAGEARVEQTAR